MSYVRGPGVQHWHSIGTITDGPFAPLVGYGEFMTFPTANQAIYVPVQVNQRAVVKKLWFANLNTATGNYDIGLYSADGTRILGRGSTAKTTSSVTITWDCTDTTVGPGIYYMALVSSNTTDTFFGANLAAPVCTAAGLLTENTALPLPATATFALSHSLTFAPVMGMFLDTRVS